MSLPTILQSPIEILIIDNFDSFTFNLYQSLGLLGYTPVVIRNDFISKHQISLLNIKYLIISPGPGHPNTDSGISRDAIKHFAGKVPILGVCMGLECVVDLYGGQITYAGEIMHGKLSEIKHDARGIFKDIPQSFNSTRYHSLSASLSTLPDCLAITATTANSGVIMAIRHRTYTIEAVQYHPESILSEHGDTLLKNFLRLKGGTWDENPHTSVSDQSLPSFTADPDANSPKVQTILEKIYAQRLKDVALAKSSPGTSPADLSVLLSMHLTPPLIPLVPRLLAHRTQDNQAPALMAEIKRASPSKGDIAPFASAPAQALLYALAGASVISVLTEPHWFRGSLSDLAAVRQAVAHLPNRPAILRKDFVLDEYQIAEARIHGADTVLLIVAMLPHHRLAALYAYAVQLGMEPLVEVNNAREMAAARDLGAKVIGVNNRNLHDFSVDLATTSRLADMARDPSVVLCALSGIASPADVQRYAAEGVRAVLVGEALMRAPDTTAFIRTLLSLPPPPPPTPIPAPLIKICGIRTPAEAHACAAAGADMLGLVFAPSSSRCITPAAAHDICTAIRAARPAPTDANADAPATPTGAWFAAHAAGLARTRPLLVGVFQDQPLAQVRAVLERVPLDLVQLHGAEPVEWARFLPLPVIRAFGVPSSGSGGTPAPSAALKEITRPGYHQFVLLDAAGAGGAGVSGGTGRSVDWVSARQVVDAGEGVVERGLVGGGGENGEGGDGDGKGGGGDGKGRGPMPVILAGGLTPENVAEAVAAVRPWAVDVSGGVENAERTGKDMERVRAFVRAAKNDEGAEVQ